MKGLNRTGPFFVFVLEEGRNLFLFFLCPCQCQLLLCLKVTFRGNCNYFAKNVSAILKPFQTRSSHACFELNFNAGANI